MDCYFIITASLLDCIIPELKYLNPECYLTGALEQYGCSCPAKSYEALKYIV
jgi:hypothetical protein